MLLVETTRPMEWKRRLGSGSRRLVSLVIWIYPLAKGVFTSAFHLDSSVEGLVGRDGRVLFGTVRRRHCAKCMLRGNHAVPNLSTAIMYG